MNKAWKSFRDHVQYLEDGELKMWLQIFLYKFTDPYAREVWHHLPWWRKYIRYKTEEEEDKGHQDKSDQAKQEMLGHVQQVIV